MNQLADPHTPGRPAGIAHQDLIALAAAAQTEAPELAIPREVDRIAQRIVGHRFLTVMRFHPETMELERIYSSHPAEYPVGGRKGATGTPWAEQVLKRGEVLIGTSPEDLERAFEDSPALIGLGLGSVVNTPIRFGGRCLGTLNLFHGPHWYRPGDGQFTRPLSYLLAPVLLAPAALDRMGTSSLHSG